jgi:HPr kinase/phosphorylase
VVVQLETWDEEAHYDRTGLEPQTTEILGVSMPKVVVPLNPGKNITVIAEVVAMNHLMKYAGVDTASSFNDRLRTHMRQAVEHREEDYE